MASLNGKPEIHTIPPAPMAMAPQVLQVQADSGQMIVMLRISTKAGVAYYFMVPDEALHLAGALRRVAETSKAGLTLPGNGA